MPSSLRGVSVTTSAAPSVTAPSTVPSTSCPPPSASEMTSLRASLSASDMDPARRRLSVTSRAGSVPFASDCTPACQGRRACSTGLQGAPFTWESSRQLVTPATTATSHPYDLRLTCTAAGEHLHQLRDPPRPQQSQFVPLHRRKLSRAANRRDCQPAGLGCSFQLRRR